METTNKKIRGSAFVDDEGLFVFTPYASQEPGVRAMKLVYSSKMCTAWSGRKRNSVRLFWNAGPENVNKTPEKTSLGQLFVELTRAWAALRAYENKHPRGGMRGKKKGGER